MNKDDVPDIIKEVGFDFHWEEKKVWKLDVPTTEMYIGELTWHLDIPFCSHQGGAYNLKPRDIIEHQTDYESEYERTMNADLKYPIDIMENKGRWLILDGLHRLMKAYILKMRTAHVRIIPREKIPQILKDDVDD